MHQPLFGASIPVIIAMLIYSKNKRRASLHMLVCTPALMLVCAVWAVIPDIPRLVGFSSLYYKMQSSPWANIFFLHQWIDTIEAAWFDACTPLFNTLFIIIVTLPLITAWRELALRERA